MALWPRDLKPAPFPPTIPPPQITKGKLHGSIDVRLSVMSINKKAQRIDLDTEDNIYHLKVTSLRASWYLGPPAWKKQWGTQEGGEGLRVCP